MPLSPSGHTDTFSRDNLPPVDQWPDLVFDLPELQYPERLNCAVALLDDTIAAHGADRPCLLSPTETWTYAEVRRTAHQVAAVLVEDLGLAPGNRVLLRGRTRRGWPSAGSASYSPVASRSRQWRCCGQRNSRSSARSRS